ncbi:MAG: DMT family transporter [Clostridia bacterium]|nr:DMT family transporter [Candidatus Limimonas egerieequi]MCQ2488943.1 DMT family transporter [Clostridia bacterium]
MKSKIIRQTVFPLLAAFIWGSAFVAQYMGADIMPAFAFNTVRNFIAIWFLSLIVLVFDLIRRKNPSFEPDYVHSNKELFKGGTLCGITLGIAMNLQQFGIAGSGAGKSGFLTALYIVIIPVLGIFFKQKQSLRVWISVVISVIGLYLLCIKEDFSIETSDLYLLGCALAFSIQMMLVSHYVKRVDGIRLSCYQFAIAAIVSAIFMLAAHEVPTFEMIKLSIGPLLYTAILSSGVAYTLQIFAQKGTNIAVVSLLLCLESVFATISGAVILHEVMSLREYIGCIVMFSAVIISQIPGKKEVLEQ